MTKLQNFYLQVNQFTGGIPPSFGNMAAIAVLYVHVNKLTGNIPTTMFKLPNLRILYLNSNMLNGTIPAGIGQWRKMQDMYARVIATFDTLILRNLSQNQLTGAIPDIFQNYTVLYRLYFEFINQVL